MTVFSMIKIFPGLFLFTYITISAQSFPGDEFLNLSVEQGLSSSNVNSIIQDKMGFLWFGTENGLNRFDGYNFKIYRNERGNKNSLSNNFIWSICEDSSGFIWIGTDGGGLNRFDPVTESFERFTFNENDSTSLSSDAVQYVYSDNDDNIWAGTWGGGLNLYVPDKNYFIRYPKDNNSSESANYKIFTIFEDSRNNLWTGTDEHGLISIDKESRKFKRIPGIHSASDILEQPDGKLLIGTNGEGIKFFDPVTLQFSRSIQNMPDHVWKIFRDKQGLIWAASSVGEKSVVSDLDKIEILDLPSNDIRTFFEDKSGILWIGTVGKGIFKINRSIQQFRQIQNLTDQFAFTLEEDYSGKIWIGTYYGGINIFIPGENTVSQFNPWEKSSDAIIRYLLKDSQNSMWIGPYYGQLTRFHPSSQSPEYFDLDFDKHNPNANLVRIIYEDRDGIFWFGSLGSGGLTSYNPENSEFTHYSSATEKIRLSGDDVTAITEDNYGNLWIGTYSFGLNKYNKKTGEIKHFVREENNPSSLPDNKITELFTDSQNNLWIGTYSGGLCKFNYDTEDFRLFSEESGFISGSVFGILEDDNNNLWVSSARGISRFNYKTGMIMNFDRLDGIQKGEFNSSARLKTSGGEMYFGGIEGVTYFHPDSIGNFKDEFPIVFTSFKVYNEDLKPGKNITYSDGVTLDYYENIFSVEFASLDYSAPERIEYAYKLEGLNDEWIKTGNRRFANFTHLDPGKYVLKVKGTNSHKVWREIPAELSIIINPPFWLTWWFRILSLAAFAGFILLVYKRRTTQLKREREAQIDFSKRLIQSQENERKRIASELHDSLGQDLLVIKNVAMINKAASEFFDDIAKTAGSAIDEVRRIAYNLHPYQLDSLGLTKAIASMINQISESSAIKFDLASDNIDGILSKEKEISVFRIIQENLNNILKHSGAEKAFILISLENNFLQIDIRDNGRGFDFEKISKKSKGFGLKNLQNRIKLLGGTIQYSSSTEYATIVLIKIPVQNGKN